VVRWTSPKVGAWSISPRPAARCGSAGTGRTERPRVVAGTAGAWFKEKAHPRGSTTGGNLSACRRTAYAKGWSDGSAAFLLAGRPPGYGGDNGVGFNKGLRRSGGRITVLGGQRQAMDERPGQRQGDGQRQPHPQAPGKKYPHNQGPFVVPALPALSRAKRILSRWYSSARGDAVAQTASAPERHPARTLVEHPCRWSGDWIGNHPGRRTPSWMRFPAAHIFHMLL
jgi:hypothetical protein